MNTLRLGIFVEWETRSHLLGAICLLLPRSMPMKEVDRWLRVARPRSTNYRIYDHEWYELPEVTG